MAQKNRDAAALCVLVSLGFSLPSVGFCQHAYTIGWLQKVVNKMFSNGAKCKMIMVTSNTDGIYATMDQQAKIKEPKEPVEKQGFNLWEWVKALSTLVIVGVFSFKVYQTPIALTVDFPTLLSLLLGFFSVGLAALFYFKATDTSNAFYDNTNKFTKDIAQLLAKIEAGFGERLKNIEDSNTSVRDQFFRLAQKRQALESEIEEEESEVEKIKAEKDKIINDLIQKADMTDEERSKLKEELQEKEDALVLMNEKLSGYEKQIKHVKTVLEKSRDQRTHVFSGLSHGVLNSSLTDRTDSLEDKPIPHIEAKSIVGNFCMGYTSFSALIHEINHGYPPQSVIVAMKSLNIIDGSGKLTRPGRSQIREYFKLGEMDRE